MKDFVIRDERNNCDIGLLFPAPVYVSQVDNFKDIQNEIRSYIRGVKFESTPPDWGPTHLISDPTFSSNILKDLNIFSTELRVHVERYCKSLWRRPIPNDYSADYSCVGSWFALFKKGHYGQIHCHPGCDISGVYYYKTNGNDGGIFFESPNLAAHMSNLFSPIRYTPDPLEGKIILFPSWLPHGVMTNDTHNQRISISFNLKFSEH